MSLQEQCDLLTMNRTSLYYRPVEVSEEEISTKRRIDEIYTAHPYYGSRRIAVVLGKEIPISRPTVQRYMREMGIAGICPGPNLSKRNQQQGIYCHLLRNLVVKRPNQVWGIDITYIRLRAGWMYLVAVLDWYSRFVVSWELEQNLEIAFVLRAVHQALGQAKPEIWNSDQGSHFTSPQYTALLQAADFQISMDGKGRALAVCRRGIEHGQICLSEHRIMLVYVQNGPVLHKNDLKMRCMRPKKRPDQGDISLSDRLLDNIFTERLWRTIKYEEVYLKEYTGPRDARQGLSAYLTFYNQDRPHQSLGYRTPAAVYRLPTRAAAEAAAAYKP